VKESKLEKYEADLMELKATVLSKFKEDREIMFLDECIFSFSTNATRAYSNKK